MMKDGSLCYEIGRNMLVAAIEPDTLLGALGATEILLVGRACHLFPWPPAHHTAIHLTRDSTGDATLLLQADEQHAEKGGKQQQKFGLKF